MRAWVRRAPVRAVCPVLRRPMQTVATEPPKVLYFDLDGLPQKRVTPKKSSVQKRRDYAVQQAENAARNDAAAEAAKKHGLADVWQIRTALICERPQILVPEPEEWLAKYIEWRHRWDRLVLAQYPNINILDEDIEQAKQRQADEKRHAEARAKMLETETAEERAARERKEQREERIMQMRLQEREKHIEKPGPRITEADHKNDFRSLYRRLEYKLFLIVQDKGAVHWRFPEGPYQPAPGVDLRKTVMREFERECGADMTVFHNGHLPINFFASELPPEQQKKLKTYGTKTFFHYACYIKGPVVLAPGIADYAWVTRDELKARLQPDYHDRILPSLPTDGKYEAVPRQDYIDPGKQRR